MACAGELGLEAGAQDRELYFYQNVDGEKTWHKATRPDLPLRNNAGAIVDRDAWDAEYTERSKGMWSKPVSPWPSGTFPAYRLGRVQNQTGSL